MGSDWIDVSVPLREGMVRWPGDPPFACETVSDVSRGDSATVSALSMCAHAGTHVDAPLHSFPGAAGIDRVPLDAVVGRARVIELRDPGPIRPESLRGHRIEACERVLLKTGNSGRCWRADEFVDDFVHLTPESARVLAAARPWLVGVDYLSVGAYRGEGAEVHRILLEAGIWIVEGLDLSAVGAGDYDLVCLPLRIAGGDGAPARAIVRPLGAAAPRLR